MKKYTEPTMLVKRFGCENVVTLSRIDPVVNTDGYIDENKNPFSEDTATYVFKWK